MKKILTLLFVILAGTSGFCQEEERPENTGDNFSLEGALALFKKAATIEEFEQLINDENNNVTNLDLNNDGQIDYIVVDDIQEVDTHAIVLSTFLNETEKQDIAIIGIEKTGANEATLQIEGDADLFAENTFVEPSEFTEKVTGGKGPIASSINFTAIAVNVWFWPSVQFIYAPRYMAWHSPWRWALYPKWWKPWKPFRHSIFYSRCAPHRIYYHRVSNRSVIRAHKLYSPKRHRSTLVIHNRRGTTVIHQNRRGNVRAIKVRNGAVRSGGRR